MTKYKSLGNFINGSFINEGNIALTSKNPSADYQPILTVTTDEGHIPLAIKSARNAHKSWTYLSMEQRIKVLLSLKASFQKHEEAMANAISLEMGKVKSEALTEAKLLSARIDLIINHGLKRVQTESFYEQRAETSYHNQGVLVVIGPYNFPAHLVNSHVIPSILLGNTVIIKPSEVCPLVAQVYAECVQQSNLLPGVVNVIHGDGRFGKILVEHNEIDGVLFTGSYRTGRLLKEALLDQPHKILALEMGGKNFSVVMHDADLGQALLEIIQAAFLTTGQRCTATSRVLVHDYIYERFRAMLINAVRKLKPCMPEEPGMFGPMATKGALDNFLRGLAKGKAEGVDVLLDSEVMDKGAFVTPSVYQVSKHHPLNYYLYEELFGPNIAIEPFSNLDEAIARINQSPYGLSNAIFTFDEHNGERIYRETKSGVLNINRSTNNALGQLPFGGVNRSGNQRPAGIDAVRYATFPVAITALPYGESAASKTLTKQFADLLVADLPLSTITARHQLEAIFEVHGVYSDKASGNYLSFSRASFNGLAHHTENFFLELANIFNAAIIFDDKKFTVDISRIHNFENLKALLSECLARFASISGLSFKKIINDINVPPGLEIPRSRAMLDRLYKGQFTPAERKALVADLKRSKGPFLVSIDDDPLVLFDAASQIATLGAGFMADTFQDSYDTNQFDLALMRNCDLSLPEQNERCETYKDALKSKRDLENFLHEKTEHRFKFVAYGAAGAEANEIAFDLARLNGPGGTRIIAFEGAFHGRTIMALQATYNKEKRGPFAFLGFEAIFLPFPEMKNPDQQPLIDKNWLEELSRGQIPEVKNDPLLEKEIATLKNLKDEVLKGNVCTVIIEPMQCEGGDKYASDRFYSGLRALTRALKVPLIFDEVQTGFHLGRKFFWYQQMNFIDYQGKKEIPDCITLAKKAQLGICLSVWENQRSYTPHVIQLKRGLLHARAIEKANVLIYEEKAKKELARLKEYFPELVLNPRACGFAFAFDMPTTFHANTFIDQRFHNGFMVYIAGESTLRFRLNTVSKDEQINRLFENIFLTLIDVRDHSKTTRLRRKATVEKTSSPIDDISISMLTAESFARHKNEIEAIENASYEEGRRDSMDTLLSWLKIKDSVGILLTRKVLNQEMVVAYAIGGPLEHATADGTTTDLMRGRNNTFYSANITVQENMRGLGLGNILKREQVKIVSRMRTDDGKRRYLFMSGRNRVGLTSVMNQINDNLYAYTVSIHDHQYNEKGAQATYYRLPVAPSLHELILPNRTSLDCQNSLQRIFKIPPKSMFEAISHNEWRPLACSKITLSNWATPHVVRYSELLRALMPKHLQHAYFTSGRDEVLDKGLRCLRFHRKDADIAIGFSHQWLGNNTAAARSLSHDENCEQPFSFFNWPKIAHPARAGNAASLEELHRTLKRYDPEKILGIIVELMGERSGFIFNDDYLAALEEVRSTLGIPLVFVENASSFMRNGFSLFLSDSLSVKANMVLWYTGGQLGHVLVDDNYYTDKPLTLISTWDGDEISMARAYHHLTAASLCSPTKIREFKDALKRIVNVEIHGQGLWHGVYLPNDDAVLKARRHARSKGVYFGAGFNSSLMVCPKLDFSDADFAQVIDVLQEVVL